MKSHKLQEFFNHCIRNKILVIRYLLVNKVGLPKALVIGILSFIEGTLKFVRILSS